MFLVVLGLGCLVLGFFLHFGGSKVILLCEWAKQYAAAGMSFLLCVLIIYLLFQITFLFE